MAYAEINGLKMYYETHGDGGVPLVLVPGSLMTASAFTSMIPALSKTRQVIVTEMQGHGRTADIDRPFDCRTFADDIAALLAHLGVKQADVFGFSLGGGIALQLALHHATVLRKVVIASSGFNKNGWHPEAHATTDFLTPEALAGSPFEQEYMQLAPNPENWPVLLKKIRAIDLDATQATPEQIKGLTTPILLIIGDADIIQADHSVEFFKLLGGQVFSFMGSSTQSQLAILPGTSHIEVLNRPELPTYIDNFLTTKKDNV